MHSFRYLVKEGFKNLWNNGIMSTASVLVMTCCMVLTGGATLISLSINQSLKLVEHRNSMTVYLKKDTSKEKVEEIGKEISKVPNISKCEYYSSNQASEKYKDVLGDLYEIVLEGDNPFPEAYHITMDELSNYKDTIAKINLIDGVESISDRSETAKKLSDFDKMVTKAGIGIVIALGIVSLFIVSNTIKITMHNRRFEISIMKSVGATNGFIIAPFLVEGISIGVISAVISTVIIYFGYSGISRMICGILPFYSVSFKDIIWYVFGAFAAGGVFFGLSGGLISIKRYLSKEGDEVVAW